MKLVLEGSCEDKWEMKTQVLCKINEHLLLDSMWGKASGLVSSLPEDVTSNCSYFLQA